MLPTLLPEQTITPFSYYWNGHIRSGMSLKGDLYGGLGGYSTNQRATAFERGCELAASHDVVLTVSQKLPVASKLWVALSPEAEPLLTADDSHPHTTGYREDGSPVQEFPA
jgi:hypothetical protein